MVFFQSTSKTTKKHAKSPTVKYTFTVKNSAFSWGLCYYRDYILSILFSELHSYHERAETFSTALEKFTGDLNKKLKMNTLTIESFDPFCTCIEENPLLLRAPNIFF
jgi:hypothetical protein